MTFKAPSYDSIRDGILRDIRSLLPDADIGSDSDNFIRSAAVAAAIEGIYQHQIWLYRQIFPDTADDAELLHHAANRGIKQRAAVAATGVVVVTGTDGTPVLAGSTFKHVATGATLIATADAKVNGKIGRVSVVSEKTGVEMNGLTDAVMFTSPPLGLDAMATLAAPLSGGSDVESPSSVLSRLLELLRNPPAGGASYDYKRWALEVDGVATAKVFPKRRGPNTVDIVITGQEGAPSVQVIEACTAHIEQLRPVTAEVFVFAPLIKMVDATASIELISGYSLAEVQKSAQAAFVEEVSSLGPDEPLKRNRIATILGNTVGVADYTLHTPTANMPATEVYGAIGWLRPGKLTLSLAE